MTSKGQKNRTNRSERQPSLLSLDGGAGTGCDLGLNDTVVVLGEPSELGDRLSQDSMLQASRDGI